METLQRELVRLIVEALSLRDVDPETIDADTPLFAGGLGLDSVDVLELGVVLDERYGIRIKSDDEGHKAAFQTVGTLTQLVEREGKRG